MFNMKGFIMNLHKVCDFGLIYLLLCPFFNCLERTLSLLQGAEIQINTTKHINNSFGVSTLDDIQDLFKKAENGDANAQYELAQIYAKGQLLLQDKKRFPCDHPPRLKHYRLNGWDKTSAENWQF